MDIIEQTPNLKALPRKTSAEQSFSIQEQQVVNEQASNLDISTKAQAMAVKSYAECDLLSKTSLERVSPPKMEDKVIISLGHINSIFTTL